MNWGFFVLSNLSLYDRELSAKIGTWIVMLTDLGFPRLYDEGVVDGNNVDTLNAFKQMKSIP